MVKKTHDWIAYNKVRHKNPPRETLLFALKKFSDESKKTLTAYDIGCGPGNDTRELLKNNWQVVASDQNPDVLNYLLPLVKKFPKKLEIQICPFTEIKWKKADLVNASFTLPFCLPEEFNSIWKKIIENIKSKGRFSGQFFGPEDEWKHIIKMSKSRVLKLFSGFEFEYFCEMKKYDTTAMGELKQMHIFHIVARKK